MRYGNPSKKTRVHASLKGHSVTFPGKGSVKKDAAPEGALVAEDGIVFVYVPPVIRDEVAAAGMLPESEIEEPAEKTGPKRPEVTSELQKQVFAAFDMLIEANNREDFSGTGIPKSSAVEKLLGYPLTNSEVKDQWRDYMAAKKDGS